MNSKPQSPPGQKTGKFMALVAWLLVMGILTWIFAGIEEKQYNPNQQITSYQRDGAVEVVLKRNRNGHYVATGNINNKPVIFMVDTGATHVAIPLHLQEELGLERGMAVPINTANGRTTAYLTTVPLLTLGELQFRDVRGGLAAGLHGNQILLGMSVLAKLTLVQRGDELILRQE